MGPCSSDDHLGAGKQRGLGGMAGSPAGENLTESGTGPDEPFYPLIITSNILNRSLACNACGSFRGITITSPAVRV